MESSKRRTIPLAGAALWLIGISAAFCILSLAMIARPVARMTLVGVAIAAVVFLAIGVAVIRALVRSPGAVPPRTAEHRVMLKWFVWIVVGEVVAIMVVNAVCAITQHLEAIVPLDVLIVGIHFLPLAYLFRVPRYYAMGGLFSAVNVLVMALVPVHTQIGAVGAWYVLPALGCAPVAWVTAALNLREAWQGISS